MLHFLSCAFKTYRKNPRFGGSQQSTRDQDLLRLTLANSSVYPCFNKGIWWRTTEWGSRVSDHLNREAYLWRTCGVLVDLKHKYYFRCILIFFFFQMKVSVKLWGTTWSVWRSCEAGIIPYHPDISNYIFLHILWWRRGSKDTTPFR